MEDMVPTLQRSEPTALSSRAYWSTLQRIIQREIIRRVRSYGASVALDVLVVTAAFESATIVRFIDTSTVVQETRSLFIPCAFAGVLYAIIAYLVGLHRRLWRYASLKDGFALVRAVGFAMLLIGALDLVGFSFGPIPSLDGNRRLLPLSVVLGGTFLSFLYLGSLKVLPKVIRTRQPSPPVGAAIDITRVLIVGAGQAGATLAARFLLSSTDGYRVVGFVDDNPTKWHGRIREIPILGPIEDIPRLGDQFAIDLIALALPSAGPVRIGEIIAICQRTSASIKILPGLEQMVGRQPHPLHLRDVNVADLLGRDIVPLHAPEAEHFLAGKTVLVTGAAGSIGSELCRQLVTYKPEKLIALDNNETGLFDLAASLQQPDDAARLQLRIGDITDAWSMSRLFIDMQPHVVFHAAAYKHVPLLEQHPEQAARINVLGTYHLCRLAARYGVEAFVFVSSDKAAEPVSMLGASKRIGEIIVQAMGESAKSATRFCAVRFGNVIGSRGSVVPVFTQQIERGGPVTVTHPEATRYFMTIPEACGLVILTSTFADRGGLFLLDMGDPVRIADLAAKMIRLRGLRVGRDISIVYTGLRPGERLHEVLAGPDEALQLATHSKIHRVLHRGHIATPSDMDEWIHSVEEALVRGSSTLVRDRLFDLTRTKASA